MSIISIPKQYADASPVYRSMSEQLGRGAQFTGGAWDYDINRRTISAESDSKSTG